MSETIINIEESLSALVKAHVNAIPDGAYKSMKSDALATFNELGIPARKSEAYKYTQIERILDKSFELSDATTSSIWTTEKCQSEFYQAVGNHLVFINGAYHPDFSIIKSGDDLSIIALNESSASKKAVQQYLGKIRGAESDAFAHLNLAGFKNGLLLDVPRGKQALDTFIYHFIDRSAQTVNFPRILAVTEEGSSLNIYEKTYSEGSENALTIALFEADVKTNAELRYTKIQNFQDDNYTVEGIYANQERDSRFYTNTFTFKGTLTRNNIFINIDGENCESHMHGLYHMSGADHVDNNTSVDHLKPHSFSNELYKGILDENSRGVFNGKIYVRPDAQKTNAFQSNNNILLSETATINTKPQLEIWADDVKCSHGCTTGQLDEEALFYLRSRGIAKDKARALMLNAFANEVLDEVKSEVVKEEVEQLILNKLGQ